VTTILPARDEHSLNDFHVLEVHTPGFELPIREVAEASARRRESLTCPEHGSSEAALCIRVPVP
jgi:hypothetical protein